MSAHFHAELGPFRVEVRLDDAGIHMQRGPVSQDVGWDSITGATLIRTAYRNDSDDQEDEKRAARLLGPQTAEKIKELRDNVGQIVVAYRDSKNRLRDTEVPAPLTDMAFLQEFATRLGKRWLSESRNREQAARRLHTNPGLFTYILVLLALLAVVAAVAATALFGLLAPLLNLLSIQQMLLDLQDGNFVSLGSHLASYLALFVMGYLLHRVIRARLDAYKGRMRSSRITPP